MQLAMVGSAESSRMAKVEYQGQLFQNEHLISKSQVDASALVFFIGQCVDLSLSNCLMFFVYASRRFINHLLAETMIVYRHGS